jgi:hypothetical protein
MTDEDSGQTKYDNLSIQYFDGKQYWELDEDQRIEIIDLWNEKNQ